VPGLLQAALRPSPAILTRLTSASKSATDAVRPAQATHKLVSTKPETYATLI